jgi:1-aminocyclopropane-1-carboxylate deaminase/D-cysteine desulfhydrase-like pyridoxal-dependent ACC family enzyme
MEQAKGGARPMDCMMKVGLVQNMSEMIRLTNIRILVVVVGGAGSVAGELARLNLSVML